MNDWLHRLTRDWPERRSPTRADLAYDAKGMREWIAHLPLANPAATSRQLFDAVSAMNRLLLDPQVRIEALEALREPIAQVVLTLDRQLQVESFPLPPAKLQVGRQSQDFEAALAQGYMQSLYDLVAPSGKVPFLKGKAVGQAATRALQHGAAVLTKAYLVYYTPAPGAWLRMHELYIAAHTLRVDDKTITDPLLRGAEVSPRAAYCHALLLALSNPYRFSQRDMDEVVALTRAWAPFCRISQGQAPEGAFAIDTDQDCSLGYVPDERRAAVSGLLSFDPNPAAQMVLSQVQMLPPGGELVNFRLRGGVAISAQRSFVERLVRGWQGGAERGHARLSAGHQLDTVLGLHALHAALADGEDFDAFMRRVRGEAISLSGSNSAAAWATQQGDTVRSTRQRAKVLDQSLGGYHLSWELGESLRAKIGEVIGLAPPAPDDETQDWMVGVLRWIRSDPSGRVDAGVELLSRRAQPVGVATFDGAGLIRPAMRALLLADDAGSGFSLLAPQLFDAAATEVELTRPADPSDWQSEASVDCLRHIQLADSWGGYLRVRVGVPEGEQSSSTDSVTIPPGIAATGT